MSDNWLGWRKRIEDLIRSRAARVGLAVGLMVFGAWAFVPYIAYKVAPTAYVNAELIRITAPINGQLTQDLPHKGDFISAPTAARLIESNTDRSGLVSLERQYEEYQQKARLAASQITELNAADIAFTQRMSAYQSALANRQESEMVEVQRELKACRDIAGVKRSALDRAEELNQKQLLAQIQLEKVKGEYFNAVQTCEIISGKEQRLKAEREASAKGSFIQDGNSAPSFAQERSGILLSRQERERELLDSRARADQLQAQISALRSHMDHLEHFDTNLPAGYMVWSVKASPGTAVVEGQTILELANCRNPFLIVQFPERELAGIAVGDTADIRLVGEDEWRRGTVRRLRGSAARTDDLLLAAAAPMPEDHFIVAEISLPPDEKQVEANRACNIGRLAEVRLQRHSFALLSWLSGKTRVAANTQ
jgi:multidrug resistance efflux pump